MHYVGNEANWRELEDNVKRAILIVDPTQRVVEDGHVVAWDVYTSRGRRSQTVHLQMWRPVRPDHNRYQFVGETVTVALWIGHSRFTLYPRDRIPVRRGDVIGIYFPKYNPVPWSVAECSHGNEHLYKYNPYGPTMARDSIADVVFDRAMTDWNPCRQYSVNVTVMSDQGSLFFHMSIVFACTSYCRRYRGGSPTAV